MPDGRKPSEAAEATVARYREALWRCYLASGADLDGDTCEGFFAAADKPAEYIAEAVEELRRDYDQGITRADGESID